MADLPSVNIAEIENFKRISKSSADTSVFMLNLNRYSEEAGYPEGTLYKNYMSILEKLLLEVGGKVLWRTNVQSQVVGNQKIDEALGIWYPSHKSFMQLMNAPSSKENMRLRGLAVAYADLHKCEDYTK
tara:strand:- start:84 stop:470 length:387 start_codon:yes stop_codon:yes gene_type:complete